MGKNTREIIHYLRFKVTESAAATYTEKEIITNLSAERGVMMNIHGLELFRENITELTEVAAGASESLNVQLTRDTKASMVNLDDVDVLVRERFTVGRSAAIGTDAGPLWFTTEATQRIIFPKPVPYINPKIYLGIQGSDATQVHLVYGRILYTLEEISKMEFLELLSSLT